MADFVCHGQSRPLSFGSLQAEFFASRHCHGLFLADHPPVDGGSDLIRSVPRRTQADSVDFFRVRLSPPRRMLWRTGRRIRSVRSDPIGSTADPPRTKSADYLYSRILRPLNGHFSVIFFDFSFILYTIDSFGCTHFSKFLFLGPFFAHPELKFVSSLVVLY